MPKRTIWSSGHEITKSVLDWSEEAAGDEFQNRIKALTKRPGVSVRYASDDKLLPRSNVSDSIIEISPGLAVNSSGAVSELEDWYELHCKDSDAGKYIQMTFYTVDSESIAHPVSGVKSNTKRDIDIEGDRIILKMGTENFKHITLGQIVTVDSGSSVTVDITKDVGHRQLFSTYEPDINNPTLPSNVVLLTGYDIDFLTVGMQYDRRQDLYGAGAWMKVSWDDSTSDAGVDHYEVMLIPSGNGEELAHYQQIDADLDINAVSFHGLVPGAVFYAKVRAVDKSPERNVSSWVLVGAGANGRTAGEEDTPGSISIAVATDSVHATVSWDPDISYGGYELCWKKDSEADFEDSSSQYVLLPSGAGVYSVPGSPGDVMYFRFRTLNRMGIYSVETSASGTIDDAPPIPINLAVTTGADESYRALSFKALQSSLVKMTPQTGWVLVQWGEDGEGGVGGADSFYVEGIGWDTDEWAPAWNAQYLTDSAGTEFLISSNTSDTLTIDGTPASGNYTIGPAATYYDIRLEYYDDEGNIVGGSVTLYPVVPDTTTGKASMEKRVGGLQMGRAYRVAVASRNSPSQGSRSIFGTTSDITVGVTGYTQLAMTPLTIETTNYGVLIKWPSVENAKGYELVYTTDGTPPDFGASRQSLKRTDRLSYAVFAPAGSRVRVKARCFDKSGLSSSNVTEKTGYAGGISSRQNIKILPIMRLNLDDSNVTNETRTLTKLAMPSTAEIIKIEANIFTLSDGPQKIRIYEEGLESGAVSVLIEETGFTEQVVSLELAYNTKIIIDAWDSDWDSSPPSTFPTIMGSVNLHYNEGTVKVFSSKAL